MSCTYVNNLISRTILTVWFNVRYNGKVIQYLHHIKLNIHYQSK